MSRSGKSLLGASVVILLATACSGEVTTVEAGSIEERIIARARIEPRRGVASVSADRIGRVVEVDVEVGDRVTAGEVLARVETRSSLDPEPIRAPIAGVVLACRVDVGDDVSRADGPIFEVAEIRELRVRFELEEEDARRVPLGARVQLTPRGGGDALAETEVSRLSPRMEPRVIGRSAGLSEETRVRTGWADVAASEAFPIGRELEVRVLLPERDVRSRVARGAVALTDGRPTLRVAGVLDREVPVRLGSADERFVEIDGVAPGTRVRVR